jgi:hypothetical protein
MPRIKRHLTKSFKSKTISSSRFSRANLTIFAIIFAAIGGYVVFKSFAAGPIASFEAESGSVTAPASVVDDSGASGGKAVHLGAALACPVSTPNMPDGPDPWGGCFPGPTTTGVPAGTTLTNYTGSCSISTNGTVIDRKIVNCDLDIRAKNVIITNSQINGAIYDNDAGEGVYSFTITDSTVHTNNVQLKGIVATDYTATRVDVSGGNSMAWCDHCTMQDSYLHHPSEDPTGTAHNSAIRMAAFATIKHNTMLCTVKSYTRADGQDTSGCSADQTGYSHDGSPPFNSTVSRNLYMPPNDGVCAYGGSSGGAGAGQVHDIVFTDNIFKRGTQPSQHGFFVCGYYGAIADFDASLPGNIWTNNRFDDGTTPANGTLIPSTNVQF